MPLNYYSSEDITMQLFMTERNGLGVRVFFKNPISKKELINSKQEWVRVGYFDPEDSMSSMPVATPLYKNRQINERFIKPHLEAKAGDTGNHLAVFANHTSFIPNAIIGQDPKDNKIALFTTLNACLTEQELVWSYAMADTNITSYHSVSSSWHPSENDIYMLQDASLWRRLSLLLSAPSLCDLTRDYITVVVRNMKQYTWMGLYIEHCISNKTLCREAQTFYATCLEYNDFSSPVPNFDIIDKETIHKLKKSPNYPAWIQNRMWDHMHQHTHIHANEHLFHISPAEKSNINMLISALITIWVHPNPSPTYVILRQIVEEISETHAFDGFPGHELHKLGALQGFVTIATHQKIPSTALVPITQLTPYCTPPLPHADVKALFSRLLSIVNMYHADVAKFNDEQRIQFGQAFNFNPLCIYIYPIRSLLQSDEHPITLRLIQTSHSEKNAFNDPFYGLKHNYWTLKQGVIAHPDAIKQLILWLEEHQAIISVFLQRMQAGTHASTYVDWRIGTPDLIQELLVSAWCQSHIYLYLQWHAQKKPWLLRLLGHLYHYKDTLQAHTHDVDWHQETLVRNTMFFSPDFTTSMQAFAWSKLYADTFVTHSDRSCSLKSRSFVLTEKGLGLFQASQACTVSADAQAACV